MCLTASRPQHGLRPRLKPQHRVGSLLHGTTAVLSTLGGTERLVAADHAAASHSCAIPQGTHAHLELMLHTKPPLGGDDRIK